MIDDAEYVYVCKACVFQRQSKPRTSSLGDMRGVFTSMIWKTPALDCNTLACSAFVVPVTDISWVEMNARKKERKKEKHFKKCGEVKMISTGDNLWIRCTQRTETKFFQVK